MKNFILTILCLAITIATHAQQIKGAKATLSTNNSKDEKTYALIVGISKYRNTNIPSLQFADKDADIFRQYLVASKVDSNNITTLLNENATSGEFWSQIVFLNDVLKKDDKLIIYFSGHGDVESKTITRDAYLLTYESPNVVYVRSAISVYHLQGYLETFSSRGVQVIFIADACHSGNLAGGREGKEAIASTLKESWKSEIKILSCQPGELSLEGKQWGGGRGLFSFELTNALAGNADKNSDGNVTLGELNRYLNLKVPEQSDPLPQYPQVNGNMETTLGKTNPNFLAMINSFTNVYSKVDLKGFDESLLENLHDSIKRNYHLFKAYLDSGIYAERLNSELSAFYYYQRIPLNEKTTMLVAVMKRNLSAALMNDLNDKLNSYTENIFNVGNDELVETRRENKILVGLLGVEKLKSLGFYSKAVFFDMVPSMIPYTMKYIYKIDSVYNRKSKAFTNFDDYRTRQTRVLEANENILRIDSALRLDSGAIYLYPIRGRANYMLGDGAESSHDFRKCVKYKPKWGNGYLFLAMYGCSTINEVKSNIHYVLGRFDHLYDKRAYHMLSVFSDVDFEPDSVEYYSFKYLKTPSFIDDSAYATLDCKEIADKLYEWKRFSTALLLYGESKKMYSRQIRINKMQSNERKTLNYIKEIDYKIALCYAGLNDTTNAISYLRMALEEGFDDYKTIDYDYDWDKIRNTPEFEKLMQKYFPDKFKK